MKVFYLSSDKHIEYIQPKVLGTCMWIYKVRATSKKCLSILSAIYAAMKCVNKWYGVL